VMRRLNVWLLPFSLGLCAALIAAMAGGWGQRAPRPSPAALAAGPPPGHHVLDVDEDRLQLTAEQRAAFRAIRDRWDAAEQRSRRAALRRMIDCGRLLVSEDLTTATISPLMTVVEEGVEDFTRRIVEALREERALLTPEQNRILTQILGERWQGIEAMLERQLDETTPDPGAPGKTGRR